MDTCSPNVVHDTNSDICCCAGSVPGQQRSKNTKMNELQGEGNEGLQVEERQDEAQDEDLHDEDEDNEPRG
eukprot:6607475-Heterocapsa_arctica.AAC.1